MSWAILISNFIIVKFISYLEQIEYIQDIESFETGIFGKQSIWKMCL